MEINNAMIIAKWTEYLDDSLYDKVIEEYEELDSKKFPFTMGEFLLYQSAINYKKANEGIKDN